MELAVPGGLHGTIPVVCATSASRPSGSRRIPVPPVPQVARELGISGDSSVGMGTAPELWNTIMGGMCAVRHPPDAV